MISCKNRALFSSIKDFGSKEIFIKEEYDRVQLIIQKIYIFMDNGIINTKFNKDFSCIKINMLFRFMRMNKINKNYICMIGFNKSFYSTQNKAIHSL